MIILFGVFLNNFKYLLSITKKYDRQINHQQICG
jgi:hypothetical protein